MEERHPVDDAPVTGVDEAVRLADRINTGLARAEAARRDGRLHEADGIALDILKLVPGLVQALALRAFVALALDDLDRAATLLEAATARVPEPAWLLMLCNLHRRRFRLDDALVAAQRAVAAATGAARLEPLLELARVRIDRDEPADAADSFLAALAVDPEHPGAHLGLGQVLLADGAFGPGWSEYEWRNRLPEAQGRVPAISAGQWNGMALPRGRLLVVCDQGFGDALQFARYLPIAAARVREVVLACGPELETLFRRIPGVSGCWHRWTDIPSFTVHCLISSLPGILETRLETIPGNTPYLSADPALVAAWRQRLDGLNRSGPRIGLFWSGRPTHPNNLRRSLSLAAFEPVVAAAGAAVLVSVQRERSTEDAASLQAQGIHDAADALASFDDTAALISNLDLLVTVDSAVAHLAGALGRSVAVLVPSPADWRWLRGREDTPWYPTMQLFRQERPGDWDAPIRRVAARVADLHDRKPIAEQTRLPALVRFGNDR